MTYICVNNFLMSFSIFLIIILNDLMLVLFLVSNDSWTQRGNRRQEYEGKITRRGLPAIAVVRRRS